MFKFAASAARLFFSIYVFALASQALALYPILSIDEVTQHADIVFTGRVAAIDNVTSGPGIFTRVTFADVSRINASADARQRQADQITLTFAGGEVNGIRMSVSGTPEVKLHGQYMVFMLDDGKSYANPVVGGSQGLYEVIVDPTSGKEVLLDARGCPITGISDSGKVEFGQPLVTLGLKGQSDSTSSDLDRYEPAVAVSEDGIVSSATPRTAADPAEPMPLEAFTGYITGQALDKPVAEPRLKIGTNGGGRLYKTVNGETVATDIIPSAPDLETPLSVVSSYNDTHSYNLQSTTRNLEETLHACGSQNLPIVMEQLPSTSLGYSAQNDAMVDYNLFMSAFQYVASDGTIGWYNSENEFCGFVSAQTLRDHFNWEWDGAIGLCIHYSSTLSECVLIQEADIFYNPAYSFTEDAISWFNTTNPNLYNLRHVAIHELSHAWGYQIKVNETYNFDQPSVMHAGYQDIYETGRGIHATDAYIFRQNYSSQTSVKSLTDIGVESYYAENGLNKSTCDRTVYTRGDTMSFNNVTVENMSRTKVDSRLRFYLSTGPGFSNTSYYQVGSSWSFNDGGLNGETFSKNTYSGNRIPSNVPPGTYYVLAYVDLQNGSSDDYSPNNLAVFTDRVTIVAPTIATNTANIGKMINVGQSILPDSFSVRNSASGTLSYSMTVSYDSTPGGWLSLGTYSGTSTGEYDTIALNFNTSTLPAGYHTASITIADPDATNSGYTVIVTIDVRSLPPPGNDNLANAILLSGQSGSVSGTNSNATKETGEPVHGTATATSVWWKWTAPISGTAVVSTSGSSFDTVLGIYTGSQYPLTLVDRNDDANGALDRTSRVEYIATAGTTYQIAVDGYSGATGSIMLNYNLTAANSSVSDWSLF